WAGRTRGLAPHPGPRGGPSAPKVPGGGRPVLPGRLAAPRGRVEVGRARGDSVEPPGQGTPPAREAFGPVWAVVLRRCPGLCPLRRGGTGCRADPAGGGNRSGRGARCGRSVGGRRDPCRPAYERSAQGHADDETQVRGRDAVGGGGPWRHGRGVPRRGPGPADGHAAGGETAERVGS